MYKSIQNILPISVPNYRWTLIMLSFILYIVYNIKKPIVQLIDEFFLK